MDIEKALFPNAWKLKSIKDGGYSATIIDVEIDPIKCVFQPDGTVEINTKDLEYIILDMRSLKMIINLIYEAEGKYEKREAKELKNPKQTDK